MSGSRRPDGETAATEIAFRGRKRRVYCRPDTSDRSIFRDVFAGRAYDLDRLKRAPELAAYVDRESRGGRKPLVIDGGANVGASALYFSLVFETARVVAVESSVENFRVLEMNTAGLDARCVNAALSATRGLAQVVDPSLPGGYCAYQAIPVEAGAAFRGKPLEIVPRVTVNDIYAEEGEGAFPFVVKVDIEGGEADLFSADTEWVAATPVVIVELHDWLMPRQGTSAPFLKCVAGLDRDFIPLGENVYSIANRLV